MNRLDLPEVSARRDPCLTVKEIPIRIVNATIGNIESAFDLVMTVLQQVSVVTPEIRAAFDPVRAAEAIPGRPLDKAALQNFARNATISFGHPVGTCKMGVDDMAVADSQLRVHGVEGLRVCDSSIIPRIVTGPTSAASHMIGAKAAQMILRTA